MRECYTARPKSTRSSLPQTENRAALISIFKLSLDILSGFAAGRGWRWLVGSYLPLPVAHRLSAFAAVSVAEKIFLLLHAKT